MKYSKLFFISLFLLIIFSLNLVGASENINCSSNQVAIDNNYENDNLKMEIDLTNIVSDNSNENLLSETNSKVIYVGHHNVTNGGNGSYGDPFTTFKAACDDVNGEENVTIYVFGGEYKLGEGMVAASNTPLKFNTNNLNIVGINGSVIIKNYFNANANNAEAFSLTSPSANFTFSNLIFDASGFTQVLKANSRGKFTFFLPFWGASYIGETMRWAGGANLGVFNNCSFINFKKITGAEFNSIFNNCFFDDKFSGTIFFQPFEKNTYHLFKNCIINVNINVMGRIFTPCDINMSDVWFSQNKIPSYITPDGSHIEPYTTGYVIPVSRYAIFNVTQNYLGNNQYEIIGKLTWNGTEDQDGMENFQPMAVNLESTTGDINKTAILNNGAFRTIYTSSNPTHKITATLHNEEIELNFNSVNITADQVNVYYGEDQNVTLNFTQPITANVTLTVSNESFKKEYQVEINGKDSIIYTIPDTLKAGTYAVDVNLTDNGFYGFNSTTLTVSKVDTVPFEVELPGEVKVGQNATIKITLPDDVDGNVTVILGNVNQILPANQTMTFNFNNLNATTYDVNVTYTGSDKYSAKNEIGSVSVGKADSSLEIENAAFTYGDVITIPFNVTNANGLTVSVLNKDEDEVATASSESGTINLDTLPAGKYTLEATTIVGSNYEWVSKTIDLTINKANSSIDIQDKEFAYAAEAIINTVTENSTGDVIATLTDENNTEIAVTVSGDNITLPKLNTGKYTLTVTTNPDENHTNTTKSATITITKTTAPMNVIVDPAENITAKDNVTLTIELPADATGDVVVKINGKKLDTIDANETITINLNNQPGEYIADITYSGDKNYESDMTTTEYTVSKDETSITAKQIDFEEGNASKIEVTVPDVESGIVLVDVAGKKFYGDIENGKATITLEGISEGNYTANIKFFGDDKYNQAITTTDVKVSEDKIIRELKEQLEEANAKVDNLTDELTNAADKIANLTAELNDANANVDNLTGDLADANAKVDNLTGDLADANAKVDNLTGDLADANARVDNLTAQLEAKLNVTDVIISGSDFTQYALDYDSGERGQNFTVQLKDVNGNVLANKTVLIGYNGKTLERVTDANGYASVQINLRDANRLTFAVAFLGDENYKANMSVYLITIKEKPVTITVAVKTYKASVKTKKYTVTLKTIKGSSADGKTYFGAGKKVTLTINGKTYTAKTNSKGQATFKITKLTKKGKYNAVVKFEGDNTYKTASKKVKITIK